MTTIREITSEIQTDLRANNIDEWVSKRYIYSKLKDKAKTLIKQENTLKLFAQTSLITTVPCVELVSMPLYDCCDLYIPEKPMVQRSVLKLPELYETLYGKYLLKVFDVMNTRTYTAVTPTEYQSLIRMQDQDPDIRYYWISNGYLIIPDSLVEKVIISGIFLEPDQAEELNSCKKTIVSEECISLLDKPFVCPEYLKSIIKDQTLQSIINSRGRLTEDSRPDQNTQSR